MLHPLKPVCEAWLEKIKLAGDIKNGRFSKYARECQNFYDADHDFMWKEEYAVNSQGGFLSKEAKSSMPKFRMQVNKPFEAVALFGPTLFHNYPNILVEPVHPPEMSPEALGFNPADPLHLQAYQQYLFQRGSMDNVRSDHARIKQFYLNWIQREADKKTHARRSITDALVAGLGVMYTRIFNPPGSNIRYPRSEYLSWSDVVKDGDAEYEEDVQWIAIKHVAPRNKVAEEYGLHFDDLEGHFQSQDAQATKQGRREAKRQRTEGRSFDLVEYWEVFSKNGFGHHLSTFSGKESKKETYDFSAFGDYTYLVVARGVPFPLNMPTMALQEEEQEQLFQRAQWPVPFWIDPNNGGGWPITQLWFYEKNQSVWPLPMFKPVIGELRFVNWCMSFLADKASAAATDYIAVAKSAGMEIKNQLETGIGPYTVLEISEIVGKSINDVVSILKAPDFHIGVWQMVADVMARVDRETGVTEMLAGLGGERQIRSAEEAAIRQSNTQVRPDDMAQRTEDFLSQTARKEILAARWALDSEADIAPVVGPEAGMVWQQQIEQQPIESLVRDFSYTIEAGSARKPNISNRIRNLTEFGQVALPVMQEMLMAGMTGPWNAYMKAYGDAIQIDTSQFMVQLPPQQEQGPSEEEQKLLFKEEEHEQKMEQNQREFQQEFDWEQRMNQLELTHKRQLNRAGSNGK